MTAHSSTSRADPLADALLPVVLHGLNNATQLLAGLNALLAAGARDALLEGRADDLAATSDEVQRLGWLLGVLASADGAHLLLDRHEARGLDVVIDTLRKALQRGGRGLAEGPALPDLAPGTYDGWQVAWAVGSFLWTAGAALPDGAALSWELERTPSAWRLVALAALDAETRTALEERARSAMGAAVGEVSFDAPDGAWALELPLGWLTVCGAERDAQRL